MATLSLEAMDALGYCRDLRVEWHAARDRHLFYERLLRAFALVFFVFVAVLLLQLAGDPEFDTEKLTALGGVVGSGGAGAYFGSLANRAKGDRDTARENYHKECPETQTEGADPNRVAARAALGTD